RARRGLPLLPRARDQPAEGLVGDARAGRLQLLPRASLHHRHSEPRDRLADPERVLHRRRSARRARPANASEVLDTLEAVALLEVNDLRTYFKTRAGEVHAVDGVSFSVDRGLTLGIVGESGCGKSVTAFSIMGLVQPPGRVVGGSVLFDGRELVGRKDKEMENIRGREISMIFQDPMTSLNPTLTIGTQITETLRRHLRMTKDDARKRAIELLEEVHIPNAAARLDDYPHRYSGGMRQRVMIAIALSCNPKLLIADEPTTALDVTVQAGILDLLRELR